MENQVVICGKILSSKTNRRIFYSIRPRVRCNESKNNTNIMFVWDNILSVCNSVIAGVISIHFLVVSAGDLAPVRNSEVSAGRELTLMPIQRWAVECAFVHAVPYTAAYKSWAYITS